MRIDNVFIEDFKNLKKFSIDLDQEEMNTVLIGQNASGKSNFMEALILIFKYLDFSKTPKGGDYFDYEINYRCRGRQIFISLKNREYNFVVDSEVVTKSKFYENKDFLPKYVFTYYSGQSDRLKKLFWDHQEKFYSEIIKKNLDLNKIDDLRRLFYVQQVHSFFVLLAFYSFVREEKKSKDFLKRLFDIEDLESILFILIQPGFKGKGDKRFWGSEGLVKHFLSAVWDFSLAPIYYSEKVRTDFRKRQTLERLYLYISNKEKLRSFVNKYFEDLKINPNNTDLFKALESTYISEILEETRIKVRKNLDGEITFRELSEGEQQLLTVLGLLKFTKDDETLVLLDEPDTHLNPRWNWEYIDLLLEHVKGRNADTEDTTQIIINTHDPLVIGSLKKSQVQIFRKNKTNGKITAEQSDIDPIGLGVDGILRNIFDLPTTLDTTTNAMLERRNELLYKELSEKLSEEENKELKNIFNDLKKMGFTQIFKDPFYTEYLIELEKYKKIHKVNFVDLDQKENIVDSIMKKFSKENK